MIPKLYDSFDLSGTTGGKDFLGRVTHCSKCFVTEVRNGSYTLELETNVNDPMADALISQRILKVKPNPHDPDQYFEIQKTTRDMNGKVTVLAKHITTLPFNLVSKGQNVKTNNVQTEHEDPAGVWYLLFNETPPYISTATPFTFTSDILTEVDFYSGFNDSKTLGEILGGSEGSMVDMYGGEFHYDNYNIYFLSSRGKVSGYKLRYGQNVSSAVQSETCLQAYSHILPHAEVQLEEGGTIFLTADIVEIPNNECKTYKVFRLDCTEAITVKLYQNSGSGRPEARDEMTAYALNYAKVNGIGKVDVSIDVTARAELDGMLNIGLCDTVKVVLDNFGITTQAKITSVTYNALLERWEKMAVGTANLSLTDLILNKRRYNL